MENNKLLNAEVMKKLQVIGNEVNKKLNGELITNIGFTLIIAPMNNTNEYLISTNLNPESNKKLLELLVYNNMKTDNIIKSENKH